MHHLADLLAEMKLTKKGARIGYDSNGYLDINGYDGPPLTEVVGKGVTAAPAREIVDRLRTVKSQAELAFITESCVWGNLAHRLMHDGLALGRGAMEISLDASATASKLMIAALGPGYQPLTAPAQANFTAGANTALPHGLATATGLRRGDVLSTYTGADVGGYNSELERTMILGEPTPEFAHHFDLMMQLQQVAFDALRPGRTLAAAERDVSRAFADLGDAASPHRPRHRPRRARGALYRQRGRDGDRGEHGADRRARFVRAGAGRIPPLRYGRGPGQRCRAAHLLPARPGEHGRPPLARPRRRHTAPGAPPDPLPPDQPSV
jgi:hypothetical protein